MSKNFDKLSLYILVKESDAFMGYFQEKIVELHKTGSNSMTAPHEKHYITK